MKLVNDDVERLETFLGSLNITLLGKFFRDITRDVCKVSSFGIQTYTRKELMFLLILKAFHDVPAF